MNGEGMNQGRNRDRRNYDSGKGKESHWRMGDRSHKEGNKTMGRGRRIRPQAYLSHMLPLVLESKPSMRMRYGWGGRFLNQEM